MVKAIDVYLEKRKTRQYVGQLRKQNRKFIFEYDEVYRYCKNPIDLGPDLSIKKKKYVALKLFPTFADRIPSKRNPAYPEYCQSVGITPSEKNSMVLLSTLGKRGPSSFIFTPVFQEFSKNDLKKFRKNLKLSIRDFAKLFDISFATIYRIENNKTTGKRTLKKVADYHRYPRMALEKIKQTGVRISDQKRQFVEAFFRSQQPDSK